MNTTIAPAMSTSLDMNVILQPWLSAQHPWYYSPAATLIDGLSDKNLSLIAPIVTYWAYALFFVFLDSRDWAWLEQYRQHPPEEFKRRNHVPGRHVAAGVLAQQALGVVLTILTVDDAKVVVWPKDPRDGMLLVAPYVIKFFNALLGKSTTTSLLTSYGSAVMYIAYWWAIPVAQFILAFFVMETWQYWIHRISHKFKFIYRHFHSWHHEIFVPYAYAALYAHPVEALLLNIFGAALGFSVPHLTTRQGIFLFVFSTTKAVDDHSGYRWPRFGPGGNENGWFCLNPYQWIFGENSEFHDLHHFDTKGINHNFSQPFTTFWDRVCGTYVASHYEPSGLGLRVTTKDKLERKTQ